MGGGNRRSKGRGRSNNSTSGNATPNNPKSRKKRGSDVKTAFFVEGGFLADWHLPSPTHTPGFRKFLLYSNLIIELLIFLFPIVLEFGCLYALFCNWVAGRNSALFLLSRFLYCYSWSLNL